MNDTEREEINKQINEIEKEYAEMIRPLCWTLAIIHFISEQLKENVKNE